MECRILHFADLHLDASFASAHNIPGVSRQRREDLRKALKRILAKARELEVDAVTIAGDLFEYERVNSDTLNFLKAQFAEVAPMPVLIAPGNHDPYFRGSPYCQIEWPHNVHIYSSTELSQYELAPGVAVWGAAHDSPSLRDNLVEHFRVTGEGCPILLIHASDTTRIPPGKDPHCPLTSAQIANSGIRFALLGHYHKSAILPSEHPLLGYPGSPEPLGFDEEGAHHVLLLEINGQDVSARLLPINATHYHTLEIDVGSALSIEDIMNSVRQLADQVDAANSFVRALLKGELHPDVEVDVDTIVRECHEPFRFLDVRNRSTQAYDLASLRDESTVRGAFVRRMLNHLDDCSTEEEEFTVRSAITHGLRALDGKEIRAI